MNTDFLIDHSNLPKMRDDAARSERPWDMGTIGAGEEWFACTFRQQEPSGYDDNRMRELLEGADEIWINAYEGMALDDRHFWHQHTDSEVEFVRHATGAGPGTRVLDIGCGDGRHAIAMRQLGCTVTGIDISPKLVAIAADRAQGLDIEWRVADARDDDLGGPYDLAVALYDVLGSSGNGSDDLALLLQIRDALVPGGHLALGVMNAEAVLPLPNGHQPASVQDFVPALERLPPSATMADSGSIFEPSLLLHFHGVFYRKEQFEGSAGRLPTELVVRDKRYTTSELLDLVHQAGLEPLELRAVQLGQWHDREADHPKAKELLLVARNPG